MATKKELERVEAGRKAALLTNVGIPVRYHNVTTTKKMHTKLEELLSSPPAPIVILAGESLEESYRAGAVLGHVALREKQRPNLVGFTALHAVRYASFKDDDMKALLKDKFYYSDILIFTNIDKGVFEVWKEPRDLAWFRSQIRKRLSRQKTTVFCISKTFTVDDFVYLLSGDKDLLTNTYTVEVNHGKN